MKKGHTTYVENITVPKRNKLSLSLSRNRAKKPRREEFLPLSVINTECSDGVELTDLTIDYAQKKIKLQEHASGFQDAIIGQKLAFSVVREGIQILHDGVNHWVMIKISNHSEVYVYDSLGRNLNHTYKNKLLYLFIMMHQIMSTLKQNLYKNNDLCQMIVVFLLLHLL